MIRTRRLDSGLRLVTEAMPEVGSVAIGFWVGSGSRDESDPVAGASHFLEHLLFKGSVARSGREIAAAVDAVGGDMNAFTTKEYTAFYVRLLSEHLDLGLDLLCDVLWHPALRQEDLEAERQVILEEIRMHADDPADLVHESFFAALFPRHALGRDILGLTESVESMGLREVRGFFAQHYCPANMVLAVAGDVDHDRVAAAVTERLAGGEGGEVPERSAPGSERRSLVLTKKPTEQVHLVVGTRAPDRHHPDRWPLHILNHVLGGGISSRLFQEVREQRGLAYSVFSERTSFHDAGALSVYAGTSPERAREVLNLVNQSMDLLASEGVTPEELDVAVGHLRADTLLSLEDSGARMGRVGRSLLLHDEVLSVEDLLDRASSVTVDSVGELASRLLTEPRTVAVVGPLGSAEMFDTAMP